jgi:2,4-dienoyl-CoA reductase-like NADH-dependent reductase (Old Yellow Enzyme family)
MSAVAILSAPLTLPCGVTIKNRLLKSAMSEALGSADGAPRDALARLYGAWADGGIGLCVTGNVMIDARALGEPGNVFIENDRHLASLRAWAAAGTRNGTALWMQLNHPGKQCPKGLNRETVSPSAVPFKKDMAALFATPRALREDEIHDLIRRFGEAAAQAQAAGFTGVQIHGAHGYLVSQFLSPHHNRRDDDWGGTPEKRRRFVLAVLAEIRRRVGSAFPIGIKLNSADFQRGGFTEDESLDTIRALSAAGIDLIEVSGGTYEAPAMTGIKQKDSTRAREAYFIDFAAKAREATSVPLVVTGGFRSAEGMAEAIHSGAVDMVGLARGLALETDLPNRLLAGQAPRFQVRPIRTRIPMVDRMAIMEVVWYTRQLHRIGRGQRPQPNASGLKVFLGYAAKSLWHGARPRRLRAAS